MVLVFVAADAVDDMLQFVVRWSATYGIDCAQ